MSHVSVMDRKMRPRTHTVAIKWEKWYQIKKKQIKTCERIAFKRQKINKIIKKKGPQMDGQE